MKLYFKKNNLLPEIILFAFAFISRFFRLDIPKNHIFDEVYHAFTASQMFKGNPAAWEWWNTPPKGFAYEWTHPPLAKEFMVVAISIFGDNSFAWRFFSALFGFGVIVLIYLITKQLFKNRTISLLAAGLASLDGLLLVMSRIGMNDMYFLFFTLLAFFLFLKNKYLFMAISLGLALSSKWTGIFSIEILGILWSFKLLYGIKIKEIKGKEIIFKILKTPLYFLLIPIIIYLLSYLPFFTGHHSPPNTGMNTFQTFIELQQQMYWYHTNLKATHAYQSVPVQWILDLRPVWIYVDYKDNSISNIYTLGNPFLMWFGLIASVYMIFEFLKSKKLEIGLLILAYFAFFLPWTFSPRIMFHYHYLPSVPFLTISLAYVISKIAESKNGQLIALLIISTIIFSFIYFFPLWTAIHVPMSLYNSYFWISSWK